MLLFVVICVIMYTCLHQVSMQQGGNMELIIFNAGGATEHYDVESKSEAKRIIRGWYDPENLKIKLYSNLGEIIADTSAIDFFDII